MKLKLIVEDLRKRTRIATPYTPPAITRDSDGLYLRFTQYPEIDMKQRRSIWALRDEEMEHGIKPDGHLENGTPFVWHKGLSGFYIDAETVEEALEIVYASRSWHIFNPHTDSFAIFEGYDASYRHGYETTEGSDFIPTAIVYFKDHGRTSTSL